ADLGVPRVVARVDPQPVLDGADAGHRRGDLDRRAALVDAPHGAAERHPALSLRDRNVGGVGDARVALERGPGLLDDDVAVAHAVLLRDRVGCVHTERPSGLRESSSPDLRYRAGTNQLPAAGRPATGADSFAGPPETLVSHASGRRFEARRADQREAPLRRVFFVV